MFQQVKSFLTDLNKTQEIGMFIAFPISLLVIFVTGNVLSIEKGIHEYYEIGVIIIATGVIFFAIYHYRIKEKSLLALKETKKALDEATMIAITDADGKINFVNNKFVEISKYSKEELIGEDHRILNSGYHSHEFFKNMWDTILSGKTWRGDIKNKAKDDTYYWAKTVIIPIINEKKKISGFTAVRTDITEQKNQEEILSEIDTKKDEFISMISHELKTPLSPIITWAGMLQEGILGNMTEKQKYGVAKIQDNSKELLNLIHDILDVHKLELGKLNFNMTEFNIKTLLSHIMEDYKVSNLEKCTFSIESEEIIIESDRLRITQVIKNFVNNALDFLPKDNPQIILSARNENDFVVISVKDNGIGISKENQKKLFKKFYQVNTSATRDHEGTGLGLSICMGIAHRLNGEIGVHSEMNQGSEFYIKIPKNATVQLIN